MRICDRGLILPAVLAGLVLVCLVLLYSVIGRNTDFTSPKALEKKADAAFRAYEMEEARLFWMEAIKKDPGNPRLYSKLGISYMLLKEPDKAVEILEKGLEWDGNNVSLNYNLALAQYYSGNAESALELSEKVLDLNKSYPEANYLKGLCLEHMERHEEAQQAYVEELNNNPGSREAWEKVKAGTGFPLSRE